jgi:hypothetical protein
MDALVVGVFLALVMGVGLVWCAVVLGRMLYDKLQARSGDQDEL